MKSKTPGMRAGGHRDFSREELLATKLRALLQRDKGRDLLDLFHALEAFHDLNTARMVECFGLYLDGGGTPISRGAPPVDGY
jgi:predicted nucleotidyltransferase component of viral defense system